MAAGTGTVSVSETHPARAVARRSDAMHTGCSFTFRNLGPVKDARLQLGDLTILAGRNNTGKSYLVYALYGLLKLWQAWPDSHRRAAASLRLAPESPETMMLLGGESEIILDLGPDGIERHRRELLQQLGVDFSAAALAQVFSSRDGDFKDASVGVSLAGDGEGAPVLGPIKYKFPEGGTLRMDIRGDQLRISLVGSRRRITPTDLHSAAMVGYMQMILGSLFPEPFILSAERFGISLFYRELDFTKHQLVDLLQKVGRDGEGRNDLPFLLIDRSTSRYAMPIKDNIDYTRSLPDRTGNRSDFHESQAHNVLRGMMGGYFRASGDEIRFRSTARRAGRKFDIPLHLASSSARGLSDLYFYLRHVARRNHLLLIDEPESHLDTANQVQLARLLAHLTSLGLRVLVSTHSDYLIKEFNNLLMLNQNFEDRDKLMKRYGYRESEVLREGAVRAYLAGEGGLTACEVDRFGIDMPMFDTTIDRINRTANELVERVEALAG